MKSLLIIDVQKYFINENNAFLPKKVENLIKSGKFQQIYATKFVNFEKSRFVKFNNWKGLISEDEQQFAFNVQKKLQGV